MESSEHNWANISETICPEMLVFGKQASWMLLFSEYPDKSHNFTNQHLIVLLPYFFSYYSCAFTINQFHNHDAEVCSPQRLVVVNKGFSYIAKTEACSRENNAGNPARVANQTTGSLHPAARRFSHKKIIREIETNSNV